MIVIYDYDQFYKCHRIDYLIKKRLHIAKAFETRRYDLGAFLTGSSVPHNDIGIDDPQNQIRPFAKITNSIPRSMRRLPTPVTYPFYLCNEIQCVCLCRYSSCETINTASNSFSICALGLNVTVLRSALHWV
jgi:hypothetical protein